MAEAAADNDLHDDMKAQIRRDVFTTEREAEARAEAIGCVGTHSHTEDGETIYMPCRTHEEYTEATGEDLKYSEDFEHDYFEFASELKAVHDEDDDDDDKEEYGRFEGYGSVFNNPDLGNDVIRNGAFRKSLRRRGPRNVKLLYQHKTDMPIGVFDSMKEDDHGLYVKGRLALKTQMGSEAYELLKMGALDGLSIGFRTQPKHYHVDKRTRKLRCPWSRGKTSPSENGKMDCVTLSIFLVQKQSKQPKRLCAPLQSEMLLWKMKRCELFET